MAELLHFGAAAAVSGIVTWIIIQAAPRLGWIEQPKTDRWHTQPTALMGGLGLFTAIAVACLVLPGMNSGTEWLCAGFLVILVGGFVDDRLGLSPRLKIAFQIAAGALAVAGGFVLTGPVLDQFGWGALLTVLWVVASTNVVNLIDGMDGVAAGVVGSSSLAAALLGYLGGDPLLLMLGLVTAGACLGFLIFNRSPARIFMGDCGSLVLGFALAMLSVMAFNTLPGDNIIRWAVLPALLAVPLIDASFVALIRLLLGQSLADSGTHHIHHRLGIVGISEKLVPVILWGLALAFGLVATVAVVNPPLFSVLFMVSLLVVMLLEILLIQHTGLLPSRQGETASDAGVRRVAHYLRKVHPWPKVVADAVVFAGALTFAAFLVKGAPLFGVPLWLALLPVVVGKLAVMQLFGIYRRGWYHGYGTPDLIRVVIAVLVGALVTVVAEYLIFGLSLGARVVVADLVTSLLGAVALRAGYRAVRHLLAGQRRAGRRVLLYGAGDAGSLAAKEFRLNGRHGLEPVGFLDDDPEKHGGVFYGMRIFGGLEDLPVAIDKLKVEGVVISTSRMSLIRRGQIFEVCRELGLECVEMRLYLREVLPYSPPEAVEVSVN